MCIAIIKFADSPLPTLEQLQNCANTNSDGAGLCYPTTNGKIQIVKGLQSAEEVHDFLQTQDFTKVPMMLHFRIGTHGVKNGPKHTHPFPIGQSTEKMEELVHLCSSAVMHNGIMGKFGYDKAISDTMAFARDALPAILKMPASARDAVLSDVLGTYNKIAYMSSNGTITKVGTWIEDGGLLWSNQSYKSYSTASSDPRKWGFAKGCGYLGCGSAYDWGDNDYPETWPSSPGDTEILLVPEQGELWSDLIEEDLAKVDEESLRSEAFEAMARYSDSKLPLGVARPDFVDAADWDAIISYRYMYGFIKDPAWELYLKRFKPVTALVADGKEPEAI